MAIRFYSEDIAFKLKGSRKVGKFIATYFLSDFDREFDCNVVFCSKERILQINKTALHHDYLTDIITFPYAQDGNYIQGELYICVDVVKSNALDYKVDFYTELLRVVFHGFLHLVGFKDKSKIQQKEMRKQEDLAIDKFLKCST